MSAVSNSVTPRSIALWITLRDVSRSVRWPKLLQPSPTAETRRPEPPRLRICMVILCEGGRWDRILAPRRRARKARRRGGPLQGKKNGPGQVRRLTGTAEASDRVTGADRTQPQ